jgi:ABC-type lipoprotein release transport system permease subunit
VVVAGSQIYLTEDQFGSNAPVSLDLIPRISTIPGIKEVIPRIIGRTYYNNYFLAVLGVSPAHLPAGVRIIQGRPVRDSGEVLLGEQAARFFGLSPGQSFSPSSDPHHVFRIAGIFHSPFRIWNSDLMIMSFEDGSGYLQTPGKATDLFILTHPGREKEVAEKLAAAGNLGRKDGPPFRIQTGSLIQSYIKRGMDTKAGIFSGIYSLAFFLALPILLVTTGLGLAGRRKEIGLMKALGWQTQEILVLLGMEHFFLALAALPFIVGLSHIWIKVFNGLGLIRFFFANQDILIPFSIPSAFFPYPFWITCGLALILTMTGSFYSSWRFSIVPPFEVLQR